MRVSNIGDVAIGTSTYDGTNPEQLVVNAGVTTSVNAIVGKGSINSYLQLNIQNQSTGTGASSDVVATADNGSETTNFVDMGINSSTNTSGVMGGVDDAYLYNVGQNFLLGTGTAAKSLVFMTGGTAQGTNERMRIDGTGNVGVGTISPTFKFDVNGAINTGKASTTNGSLTYSNSTNANTLTFNAGVTSATYALTLPTAQGAANTMMTNDGTGVLIWTTPAAAGSAWALGGNNITALKSIGSTSNKDVPFITNNIERMRLFSNVGGGLGIGAATGQNVQNPEQLLVDAGTTTSWNAIVGKGSYNNYLQLNIQNQSAGTIASSDVVATADNGNEISNYVDMGINSSGNTSGVMGSVDDAYLYNIGQNLLVGTGTAAKSLVFMTGGTSQATNERMRIDGSGNVAIGTSTFNATNIEQFVVDAGTTTSVNAIVGKGTSTTYLQSNIQNLSPGTGASSDVVATADNGSETANYVDMGINSSANTSGAMGAADDAYLYNIGQNLLIGTGTAAKSLVFMTGGTAQATNERMRIDGTGDVAIGTATSDSTNPEQLVVNAGVTTSVNAIVGKGNINSYIQLNIQNQSAGSIASSDVVATADNGNESTNFVDMGINSSGNTSGLMGGVDDAYLFNQGNAANPGGNLLIGTGTAGKALVFMTGGQTQSTNERVRIDGSGNVGIGDNAPSSTLSVAGSLKMKFVKDPVSPYNMLATDYVIINTAGAVTWTNPAASSCTGRIYRLINQGTGAVTLTRAVTTANLTTTTTLPVGTNFEIISDGTVWRKIN